MYAWDCQTSIPAETNLFAEYSEFSESWDYIPENKVSVQTDGMGRLPLQALQSSTERKRNMQVKGSKRAAFHKSSQLIWQVWKDLDTECITYVLQKNRDSTYYVIIAYD